MNGRWLEQLAVIVNAGSLTRAAERLGVTQPTLTRSMKSLEDRVGEPVVTRTRHGVRPTEIGARLAEIGNRIIKESTHADDVVRQWRSGYNYEVRVGVGPLLEHSVMNRFVETYPRHDRHILHFKTGSAVYLIPELQRGTLDLLLAPAFLDLEQSALKRETVFEDRIGILVGRKSRFFGRASEVALSELDGENWLLSGAGAGLYDPELPRDARTPAGMMFSGSIEMVSHLLRTSDAVVRMPIRLMLLAGAATQDNVLTVPGESAPRDIAIWSTEAALEHPSVRKVRDQLRVYFAELDKAVARYR